ncbi:MAG TPA: hypothetical protein EYH07_14170 [Kiloniellaceae bacterium]|nr:hypothetical protein [Kiloniellaceae bacterium]HIP79592.1 hypothetical protein [Kiloniellaceae bacterium]
MQITPGSSPLTLAMLKTLGGQTAGTGASVSAGLASPGNNELTGGTAARNEPAGPPEPGRFIPRGTFVDLKA